MFNEQTSASEQIHAGVAAATDASESTKGGGVFRVECHDAQGQLKWSAEKTNLVVNVGLQDMVSKYFTGAAYTAAWYVGIYGAAASNNPASGNTMASHAGWTEIVAYSQAARPAAVFGTATTANPSVITTSASPATFSINGTTVVGGAFLASNNTKGGTAGLLFSAADFASPGDRSVVSGDTITVTYAYSQTAT
jgi:hypothetical protein